MTDARTTLDSASSPAAAGEDPGVRAPKEKRPGGSVRSRQPLWKKLAAGGALAAVLLPAGAWLTAKLLPAPPMLEGVPFSSALTDRHGTLLELRLAEDGIYRLKTPLSEIPPAWIAATIHYEDRWFAKHPGVNVPALFRALWGTATHRPMGASTLTMQLARIRLGLETRSVSGKLAQIFWALRYEAHYAKDEILEAYLNLAPYGGNVEGAGASARVWFGRAPAELTAAQVASLTIVPQNPVARRPGRDAWREAFSRVGESLIAEGVFPETLAPAMRTEAAPAVTGPGKLPHLASHDARLVAALAPGERVRGTIDLQLQESLEALVQGTVARLAPWGITNAALAVSDARTGEVLAHVGSADFENAAIEGEVDALTAMRSPGSTLKPFLFGLALDQGLIHSETVLMDRPQGFGGWRPENADGDFAGPIPASAALLRSRNLPAVSLARQVNPDLYDLLQRAGTALPFDKTHYGLAIALGGAETTMADLLRLYGALASDGLVRPLVFGYVEGNGATGSTPVPVTLRGSGEGRNTATEPATIPILTPESALIIREILARGGETVRTASGAPVRAGFKTGTSHGFRDARAAGTVGPYVLTVWLGNFDGRGNPHLQGAAVAAPLWLEAAARIARHPGLDFPAERRVPKAGSTSGSGPAHTDAGTVNVVRLPVCRETGDVDVTLCPNRTTEAFFIPGVSPVRPTGILRRVLVDKRTGLRACAEDPEVTERRVYAFWPTHALEMLRAAGRPAPTPPAWMPGCGVTAPGRAPEILAPEAGSVRWAEADGFARVTLTAGTESDARVVHWFADGAYLGRGASNTPIVRRFGAGTHRVEAVDEKGRTQSVRFTVRRP